MTNLRTKGRTLEGMAHPSYAGARAEYREMPGLRLTAAQACRLWQLDVVLCTKVFDLLVSEGLLQQTNTGFYLAPHNRCMRSS